MKWLRHPALGAALAALAVTGVAGLSRSDIGEGPVELLERWALDRRFLLRGTVAPGPEVAIVVFDDDTTRRAGKLFERRAGWAEVIRNVRAAGAKVIGIDAVFEQPEALLGEPLSARVTGWAATHPTPEPDDAAGQLLSAVATELRGDAELSAALREGGDTVLALFTRSEPGGAEQHPSLARARYAQSTPGGPEPFVVHGLLVSIPEASTAAKGMGLAALGEDETRTVRRVPFVQRYQEGAWLPFAVPVVAAFWGVNRGAVAWLGPQQQVKVGEHTVALEKNALWLNYRGPQQTFPTFSAADVVEHKLPQGALLGKIVLIGVTRLEYDLVRTPFSRAPGVEVQATAIDNVLRGDPLQRSRDLFDLLATLGVGLVVSLLFLFRRFGPMAQSAATVGVAAAWLAGSQVVFLRATLWLPAVGPVAAAVASGMVGLVLAYSAEASQRRFLKQAFGNYLGRDALEQLLHRPGLLQLGGERRQLTVLFSDICGFTTLSEKLSPDQLVAFLNTYLSPMTRAVFTQGGLLDKYIGDAVMAVFGAPLPLADHATRALRCALEMHRDLKALNAGPLKALGLDVAIGVGLNTGDMVVGNMGSEKRFDYTVAGDAVNLASRLEGLTRVYEVFCLVGEPTRAAAGPGFSFRAIDLVQVKGKHEAVAVFELLAGPGRVVSAPTKLETWERAVAAWRAGQLTEARAAFADFAAANPDDTPCRLYLERLAKLPELAPPDFSPVAVFTTK